MSNKTLQLIDPWDENELYIFQQHMRPIIPLWLTELVDWEKAIKEINSG